MLQFFYCLLLQLSLIHIYTNRESIQIGMGMISRGEVALIVATKGAALGLLSNTLLGPVIITVVVTTIISPILLKLVFRSKSGDDDSREESQLAKGYEKVLDYTTTCLLYTSRCV